MKQRELFFDSLYQLMKKDKKIVFITADLGYFFADKIRDEMPLQFYNIGVAEQAMLSIAIGMALSDKIPICYTITPFYFRAFEQIRLYLNHESIPVILVGCGRDRDYEHEGFSHDASDDEILKQFKNITFLKPANDFDLAEIIYSGKPTYLNLKK